MTESNSNKNGSTRAFKVMTSVVVVLVIAWFAWRPNRPAADIMTDVQQAVADGDIESAQSLLKQILADDPQHAGALLVAGQLTAKQGNLEAALQYYARIPDDGSRAAVEANCLAGNLLFYQFHRLAESEQHFRQAVADAPQNLFANYGLASVLATAGRYREAFPYLLELARQEKINIPQLLQLNSAEGMVADEEVLGFLKQCQQADPTDPMPLLGLAHAAMKKGEGEQAVDLLRRVLASRPDQITAQVFLGRVLLELKAEQEFADWQAALPESADESSDIWALRGRQALMKQDSREAIRCYWEALQRDADHPRAMQEFPQLLVAQGLEELAQVALQRSHLQTRLNSLLQEVAEGQMNFEGLREAIDILESMGRLLEANAWTLAVLQQNQNLAWARQKHDLLSRHIQSTTTRTLAEFNPIRDLDFSPDSLTWSRIDDDFNLPVDSQPSPAESSEITFEDSADSSGLKFTYFNGAAPNEKTYRLYETTGGGVGILDYDGDGWPDIYLTQGCRWPFGSDDGSRYQDRLFRNVDGRHFEDVTEFTGLGDARFSQGVAVGDFDSDGFPDLYLANIGPNRLYRNRGDGTFHDISDRAAQVDEHWTTSCLVADLNGDALPDLYAVNYVTGKDVYERVCHTPTGAPSTCMPLAFEPAQDRVFMNEGDGSFAERPKIAGVNPPRGNGLGILAADFDGSGRLSVFVANDQTPNFLFVNQAASTVAEPSFAEKAMLSGVAVNRAGQNQACMGIACGDIDSDGRLDLYITNFAAEYNTLYVQQSGGLFIDATHSARLVEPSMPYLGFGTQFLDADLDGLLDIMVANGNIDDSGKAGTMYHMRPQFYHNLGQGKFGEVAAGQLGSYFATPQLGRALAVVDWNRDGMHDAVVSHLDANVALLTNSTVRHGNYLALTCCGVTSNRDAFGTTVTVRTGSRTLVHQLTAGNGYQASNERRLLFGLADATIAEQITIQWPSGKQQVFENIAGNQHYLAIEGREELLTK